MNNKSSLRRYVESLSHDARALFARRIGISRVYLYQLAARQDGRKPSPALSVAIERESGGAVTRRELRPDDWQRIWPELADPLTA